MFVVGVWCSIKVVCFQVNVIQCGAIRPLISMLEAPDPQLCEMAAFALGHLAQVLITAALISALAEDSVIESVKS